MTDSPSPALWKLAETADKVRLLQEIDRLSEQVDYWRKKAQSLERELHKEVRTARERPFGNDTPSSKQLFRPDAPEAKVARKGGAKPGHDGHGRRCAGEEDADEVVELAMPTECDRCGGELEDFKGEERSVRVAVPAHYRNLHYVVWTGWCAKCNRQVKERVPGVLPRFAASNSLLAQNVMDRYVYGMTVGTISARTRRLGRATDCAATSTGSSRTTSRSSGSAAPAGSSCRNSSTCFARRRSIRAFGLSSIRASIRSDAHKPRCPNASLIDAQARDAGLQKYQDIYRRHPDRSFQWAEDRRVPAENNMSERGVRRTVIARKTCGGSQSEDALMVREVLQSVIGSLRLRCGDPVARLTEALDAYALDKTFKIEDFLFPLQKA